MLFRILVWTLLVVTVVAAAAYAASPWLIARVAPAVAERYGIRVSAIDVTRPTHERWSLPLIDLRIGEIDVRIERLTVDYSLAALRARRVLAISAEAVLVADRSTTSSGIELPEELDMLWAMVPADRLDFPRLNISSVAPEATASGSLAFDPAAVNVAFDIDSPSLPTPLDLDARIERTGSAAVRMGAVGQADVLSLRAVPDATTHRVRLDGAVSLVDAAFVLAASLAGAKPEVGRLAATIDGSLPWPLPDHANGLADSLDATADVELAFAGLVPGSTTRVDVACVGRVTVAKGSVDVALVDGASLGTQDVAVVLGEARGALDLASRRITIARATANVTGEVLRLRDDIALTRARVDVADATLFGETSEARVTLDTEVAGFDTKTPIVVTSRIERRGDGVTATGRVALSKAGIELPVDVRGSIGARTVDISSKGRIDVKRALIAQVLPSWKQPGDLTAGAIDFDASARWSAANPSDVSAHGRLELRDVAAHWEEYTAQRVNVDLTWRVNGSTVAAETARLDVGELDVGVPVRSITANVVCCERKIVRDLKAEIFGGSITIPAFEYLPTESKADATIDGVVLADVVALQGDKVSASGTLDGRLPIRVGPDGFVIDAGRIVARPPGGHIAYKDAAAIAASAGQPGLDFALRALTDFTYETLEGDIDYAVDGTMTTKLRLRGRNPRVESGRTIQYNLNVTENVVDLLRSLRLSDRVGQGIEKRFNN